GPNNSCKEKRQKQAKQRTGDGYDNFIQRGDFRQPPAVHIPFSLDNVPRRKLRERHKASERQRTERVLDTVDCFLPDRFAEPDAEFFYVKPPPARRQKMPQFMHHDQQIEEDDDFYQDEKDASDVQ